jgi:hypothetical protein
MKGMNTAYKVALLAAGCVIVSLLPSCKEDEPSPSPPHPAVVEVFPDYYFWDDYEYVGWVGDRYYYWGPPGAWIICDPPRVQRVVVWQQAHPDWRTHATPNVQPAPAPTPGRPEPPRPPPRKHLRDHE